MLGKVCGPCILTGVKYLIFHLPSLNSSDGFKCAGLFLIWISELEVSQTEVFECKNGPLIPNRDLERAPIY